MNLQEIGAQIRRSRLGRGLTQAQLAAAAHVTRTTLNRLENGLLKDLGVRKVAALLDQVGLGLEVTDLSFESRKPNLLRQASISASVSFKEALSEEALERILLTGKVPKDYRPHMRRLLEETPAPLMNQLISQVERWAPPGKVSRNLKTIRATVGLSSPSSNR